MVRRNKANNTDDTIKELKYGIRQSNIASNEIKSMAYNNVESYDIIFEEVGKRCKSFIDNDPLINAYRKKEWNEYFHNDE